MALHRRTVLKGCLHPRWTERFRWPQSRSGERDAAARMRLAAAAATATPSAATSATRAATVLASSVASSVSNRSTASSGGRIIVRLTFAQAILPDLRGSSHPKSSTTRLASQESGKADWVLMNISANTGLESSFEVDSNNSVRPVALN